MVRNALLAAAVVCVAALPAAGQLQSAHQIRCLKELWKSGVKVSQTQGKENVSCAKASTAGRLAPMTAQSCLSADTKQRVAKSQERVIEIATKKCATETPSYGSTDPETVSAVGTSSQIELVTDIFGADVEAGLVDCSEDRDACKCQVKALKAAADLSVVELKEFANCTKRALKISTQPFLGGVLSASELERCLSDDTIGWSVAADQRGKIAKAASRLANVVDGKCGGVNFFPGSCVASGSVELASCLVDRVDCVTCLAINEMYALAVDCDSYDDGSANASCS